VLGGLVRCCGGGKGPTVGESAVGQFDLAVGLDKELDPAAVRRIQSPANRMVAAAARAEIARQLDDKKCQSD
jgi:hypothetical protein